MPTVNDYQCNLWYIVDIAKKILTYILNNVKMVNLFIKFVYITNNHYWKAQFL